LANEIGSASLRILLAKALRLFVRAAVYSLSTPVERAGVRPETLAARKSPYGM